MRYHGSAHRSSPGAKRRPRPLVALPEWPVGRHCVIRVADRDDACADRDLVGCEGIRVALAVPTLVTRAYEPRRWRRCRCVAQDALSDGGPCSPRYRLLAGYRGLGAVPNTWSQNGALTP
jgi:hypothetical protein